MASVDVDVDKSAILQTQPLILNNLDRYVSEDQLRQLKLIFVLSHLAYDCDIEKSKFLLHFKDLLLRQSNKWIQERAIPLIQSILSIINVREDEVEKLGSPQDVLEDCKTFLSYPRAVIEVCKSLTTYEFHSFKSLICADHLKCNPAKIKNCEDLCLKLHQQNKISEEAEGFEVILPYLSSRKDIQQKLTGKSIQVTEAMKQPSSLCIASVSPSSTGRCHLPFLYDKLAVQQETTTSTGFEEEETPFVQETKPEQSQTAKRGVSDSHVEDVPLNKGAHFLAPFDQSTSLSPPSTPGADENSKRDFIARKPEQESGSACGKGQLAVVTEQWMKNPLVHPSGKLTHPPRSLGLNSFLTKRFAFPTASLILFVIFGVVVWLCLSCYSTRQLFHFDDTALLSYVKIGGLPKKIVFSVDKNKTSEESTTAYVSIFTQLSDSLKFYTDVLKNPVRSAIEQLQLQSSCATGLVGISPYFYLLSGSSIDYEICLKLLFVKDTFNGQLHIFDSEKTLEDYLANEHCEDHNAIEIHNLVLGSDGQYQCTTVNMEINKNGYYFIASKTPANISYYYKYNITKIHLKSTDLSTRTCTFSDTKDCTLESDSLYKKTVVLYTHPVRNKGNSITITVSCHCSFEWLGWLYFPDLSLQEVWMLLSYLYCFCLFVLSRRF